MDDCIILLFVTRVVILPPNESQHISVPNWQFNLVEHGFHAIHNSNLEFSESPQDADQVVCQGNAAQSNTTRSLSGLLGFRKQG